MITQFEAGPILRKEIPQLAEKAYPSRASLDIYASMNYFSDYAKQAVEEHDFRAAKKCFVLAEKLYSQGDKIVRLLIENVFIYAFSSFLPNDKTERVYIKSMIPATLYSLYVKQVGHSGR